jgi:hypothetical protein
MNKFIFLVFIVLGSFFSIESQFAPTDISINYSDDEFEDDEGTEEEQENEEIEEKV